VCCMRCVTVSQRQKHDKEGWIQSQYHKLTNAHPWEEQHTWPAHFDATSTVNGNLVFEDSNNVKPRYYGDGRMKWEFKCPINCENDDITTNATCNCNEGVETEGACNCEGGCNCEQGVTTSGSCTCQEGVETPEVSSPNGEPVEFPDGAEIDEITSSDGEPVEFPNGIETDTIETSDGSPLEIPSGIEGEDGGPVSAPGGVETPSIDGPGGLPVSFPTGVSPGPPVPITIALNPNGGGGGGSGGGGPCRQGSGLLDPKEPIIGIMPDGRRVKLIGSVLSSGASLASSGVSAATSAATGAAGAVTEVVTGILGCNAGGPPLPSPSLSGSSTPGLPGVPGSNLHASLAAAIATLSGSPAGPPPTADTNAAEAVSAATSSTGYLLPSAIVPTEITIWAGGLQIPTANGSIVMMDCSELYRGHIIIVKGPPDETLVCLEREDGWAFYPIPFGEAFYEEVFSGNGTGLVAGRYLEMHVYPNNTLFEIRDADIVMPGNCSNCNLQVDATGKILGFSSGTTVITGNHTVLDTAILRGSDSAIILDENSTLINAGPTVLNGVTINQLNATEIYLNGTPLGSMVTSLTGTPNEITVSASTGDVILSLPSAVTLETLNVDTLIVNGVAPTPTTNVTITFTGATGSCTDGMNTAQVTYQAGVTPRIFAAIQTGSGSCEANELFATLTFAEPCPGPSHVDGMRWSCLVQPVFQSPYFPVTILPQTVISLSVAELYTTASLEAGENYAMYIDCTCVGPKTYPPPPPLAHKHK
jgi:hypothetical protein